MDKGDDLFDRAVMAVAKRSGRSVVVVALVCYPGLGLVLPLALHWSTLGLVEANIVGTVLAGVVGIGWLSVQLEGRDRRHLFEWTSNLRLLTSEEFEWLVGELFRREGWAVQERGLQGRPDGNVDLELRRGNTRVIVQCKRWQSYLVTVDEIRAFAGTLLREGLDGQAGIFVTLAGFTPHARAEAKAMSITLVSNRELFGRIANVRRAEPCNICNEPMILHRSAHGWWLRCVTNGCPGKRDLGNNPGRAVDLLTEAR